MIVPITRDSLQQIKNKDFLVYASRYADIETQTLLNIEAFGLPFLKNKSLKEEKDHFLSELKKCGALFGNKGKSIHTRWISDACTACRTGEGSYTTFISLKCHRDCYFCFNPNQEDYEYYQEHQRQANDEIDQLAEMKAPLTHVALTGGNR